MYIHWRSLISLACTVWCLSYFGDLLGEPTWKKYSSHIEEILRNHHNQRMPQNVELSQRVSINWISLTINIFILVCSLVFFSFVKPLTWVLWKLLLSCKNPAFLTKILPGEKAIAQMKSPTNIIRDDKNKDPNVIFTSEAFTEIATPSIANNNLNNTTCTNRELEETTRQQMAILKQLNETIQENSELSQQLSVLSKENIEIKQQIEQYRNETNRIKEKLVKVTTSLEANNKYKDFASANQEVMTRKTQSLESNLEEVQRDRDILKNKLNSMEQNYYKLKERFQHYQEEQFKTEVPEKDNNEKIIGGYEPFEIAMELNFSQMDLANKYNSINNDSNGNNNHLLNLKIDSNYCLAPSKTHFESNSKLSLDIEQMSVTSKGSNVNDTLNKWRTGDDPNFLNTMLKDVEFSKVLLDDEEIIPLEEQPSRAFKDLFQPFNIIKYISKSLATVSSNYINKDLKEADIRRPRVYGMDSTCELSSSVSLESSDDNSTLHRSISSTREFQNLMKNLFATNTNSQHKSVY